MIIIKVYLLFCVWLCIVLALIQYVRSRLLLRGAVQLKNPCSNEMRNLLIVRSIETGGSAFKCLVAACVANLFMAFL